MFISTFLGESIKTNFIPCFIKLGMTIFKAFTSCCAIVIQVLCHLLLWCLTKRLEKPVMKSSELLMKTRYNQKYYTIPDFQWINTSSLPTVIPNNLPAQSSNTPSQV